MRALIVGEFNRPGDSVGPDGDSSGEHGHWSDWDGSVFGDGYSSEWYGGVNDSERAFEHGALCVLLLAETSR